ncbi:hypothetical protein, partial [Symbiobacterium thermophilum]|uniref:hypothetical protein n=1 Tax=Symbiobacterium thermophilum TaxID=2734 RepID=UPI004047C786
MSNVFSMSKKTYRPYEPNQLLLLPPALQDWLPHDHFAYFLSDVVEATSQPPWNFVAAFFFVFRP